MTPPFSYLCLPASAITFLAPHSSLPYPGATVVADAGCGMYQVLKWIANLRARSASLISPLLIPYSFLLYLLLPKFCFAHPPLPLYLYLCLVYLCPSHSHPIHLSGSREPVLAIPRSATKVRGTKTKHYMSITNKIIDR
ncbi:hypothetical protein BDN71DRAFT_720336 [Pleurotus eryngii]|uniref:Uncharacterized protein n=1 Tax=Pleurotus eryngii TaxID=5323 RepID=A0A9P6DL13_PLEER|nr:hypothetical protein BDN71DRAFT_720336 [Pleurotus eryngii]